MVIGFESGVDTCLADTCVTIVEAMLVERIPADSDLGCVLSLGLSMEKNVAEALRTGTSKSS